MHRDDFPNPEMSTVPAQNEFISVSEFHTGRGQPPAAPVGMRSRAGHDGQRLVTERVERGTDGRRRGTEVRRRHAPELENFDVLDGELYDGAAVLGEDGRVVIELA
jgi:hypothetical protein